MQNKKNYAIIRKKPMQKKIFTTLLIILALLISIEGAYAALEIPGSSTLKEVSINVGDSTTN